MNCDKFTLRCSRQVHRANGWGCDGRGQEHGLGCGRGFGDCDQLARYRCTEHCDYDLCPDCMSTLVGFDEVLLHTISLLERVLHFSRHALLSDGQELGPAGPTEDRVTIVTSDGKEHDLAVPTLRLSVESDAQAAPTDDRAGLVPRLLVR